MEGQKSLTFHSKILIFLSEMNKSRTALERHERVNDERIVPNFLGELSLSLLENIMHVFEYLLNVSDIEEKKNSCFLSQAETSVRASDLSLAHYSTCTHCVCVECTHVCFRCCWGRRKTLQTLCVTSSTVRQEERRGQEGLFDDWQIKFCHAVFIKILQQSFQ